MNHGLVLLSGIGFIFFSGLIFFVLRFVEKCSFSERTKRIAHLCAFSTLAILCVLIFDWYSSEYIRNAVVS